MLRLEKITRKFKDKLVLDNLSVDFEKNKIYGLFGRNGVGKTTLLKIINGSDYGYKGNVLMEDELLQNHTHLLKKVFLCSQGYLDEFFNLERKLGRILKGLNKHYDFEYDKSLSLLKEFGLEENSRYYKCSLGEKSLFICIIGLCLNIDYILLDEPITGLDTINRDKIYKYILETQLEKENTFIITSHFIDEITYILNEVIFLKDQNISLNKSSEELQHCVYKVSGPKEEVLKYYEDKKQLKCIETSFNLTVMIEGEIEEKNEYLTYQYLSIEEIFEVMLS